jgi:hypothetical protein
MDKHGGMTSTGKTRNSSIRALCKFYLQSHLIQKQEKLGKERFFFFTKYFFHTSNGSLTCHKILRHGADGFTSLPKEGVLRIFIIALSRV